MRTNKLYCDRCKKEILINSIYADIEFDIYNNKDDAEDLLFEICEKCIEDLREFLK